MRKKIPVFFVCSLLIFSIRCSGGEVNKAFQKLSKGEWQSAVLYLDIVIPKVRDQYRKVKDTLRPKKQKTKADEYCILILFRGFAEMKAGKFSEAGKDFDEVDKFFDSVSINQHLFKAYAWKFFALINKKYLNQVKEEFCIERTKDAYKNYKEQKQKTEEGKYEQMLEGLMGSLDY